MSPTNHVGTRLLAPTFLPNIGHNQSASPIIALTFLTKNVRNKSAILIQRAHLYRAFLRNHIRTNFRVPSALKVTTVSRVSSALTVNRVPSSLTLLLLFRLLLHLLFLRNYESHSIGSHNQRTVLRSVMFDSIVLCLPC